MRRGAVWLTLASGACAADPLPAVLLEVDLDERLEQTVQSITVRAQDDQGGKWEETVVAAPFCLPFSLGVAAAPGARTAFIEIVARQLDQSTITKTAHLPLVPGQQLVQVTMAPCTGTACDLRIAVPAPIDQAAIDAHVAATKARCRQIAAPVPVTPVPEPPAAQREVTVCVSDRDGGPAPADEVGWIRAAVDESWVRWSRLQLTGWERCTEPSKSMVRVRVSTGAPALVLGPAATRGPNFGVRWSGEAVDLHIPPAPGSEWCPSGAERRSCVAAVAVHMFGHALGLAHAPDAGCSAEHGSALAGDALFTVTDPRSVLGTCTSTSTVLSRADRLAVRRLYGATDVPAARKTGYACTTDEYCVFVGDEVHWVPRRSASGTRRRVTRVTSIRDFFTGTGTQTLELESGVDAVLRAPEGRFTYGCDASRPSHGVPHDQVYFFYGHRYVRADGLRPACIDEPVYPQDTCTQSCRYWPFLSGRWDVFDTMLETSRSGGIVVFKGDRARRTTYDATTFVETTIAAAWPGLFTTNIDYWLTDDRGAAWAFSGDQYQEVEIGPPPNVSPAQSIFDDWLGIPF